MKSSKDLIQLVNSLTKAEKKYFTRFTASHVIGSENSYIRLFKEIEKYKDDSLYNEKNLKKELTGQGIIKYFEFTKNYLYKTILKSLNSFYYDTSINDVIKNNIKYIEILYKKGLFGSCLKIFERSLKLAYKTGNYLAIIELLRWKKNLIFEGVYGNDEFIELEKTYKTEQKIIGEIKNLTDYRVLSYHTLSLINGVNPKFRKEGIQKELQNILKNPLLRTEKEALSYQAIIYYYQILAFVYYNLGDAPEALKNWKRIITVIEDNPDSLKGNLTNYIVTLYNLLRPCLKMKMYDELEYYINKLKSLNEAKFNEVFENDRILIFSGASIYELRMNIIRGEFSSSLQNLKFIEKGVEKFSDVLLKEDKLLIFFLLSYVYFGAAKIDEALKWINKIINNKEIIQESRFYIKSKILNLIMHYEKGDYELLEYLIKAAERFHKKSSLKDQIDNIVIGLLKQLISVSSNSQRISIFKDALCQIRSEQENSGRNNSGSDKSTQSEVLIDSLNSDVFDIESWLESKISGKSFEEIVKAKR